MVGSAIVRILKKQGHTNLIMRSRSDLDLTNQLAVNTFMAEERPEQIYLAAARVGGIYANNTFPADFIYQNLIIECNVIEAARLNGIKKLLFLGSSCIYPKFTEQPMNEDALLSGKLESTNEPYAVAKIAGIKLCESYNRQYGQSHRIDYRSVMPTNLYGPGDNYHSTNSHVIPALIRRFHEAKINKANEIVVWGTGKAKREFLYVDDMAAACIYVMNLTKNIYDEVTRPMCSHINVGCGYDITIRDLSILVARTIGYEGSILFDTEKPDGAPQKLMDSSRLESIGWRAQTELEQGLHLTYADFCCNYNQG